MKKTFFLSVAVLALAFTACNSSSSNKTGSDSATVGVFDTTKLAKGAIYYQCEMDPQVVSDKPGTCPKCKMDLSKVEKK